MTLADIYDYFRTYDKHAYQVVACAGNKPSDEDIAAFEAACGRRLPSDFREFTLSPLGGLYMEVRQEIWPPAKPFQVGPFWSFLRGIKVFGIANGILDWLDLRVQYQQLADAGHASLVPFLQVAGDANLFCFGSDNRIVLWDHEVSDELEPVDATFPELLMREIRELAERKDAKVRGDDRTGVYADDYEPPKKEPKPTLPCPSCGEPLRTDKAKQCFSCGADWH